MFCILIKSVNDKEYKLFTNEIFNTVKETVNYAERHKFKKNKYNWKVVDYEPKYFKGDLC